MRGKLLLIIALFTFLPAAQVLSQTQLAKPFFMIDAQASLDVSSMKLRGNSIAELWNFESYAQNEGFGAQIKFKFGVYGRDNWQVRPYIMLGYTQFSSTDNRAYVTTGFIQPGWPGTGFNGTGTYVPSDTTGTSDFRMNMPYYAIGGEFAYYTDKAFRSSVNAGMDFNMSFIWGRETETYTYAINGAGPAGTPVEHNMPSQVRAGLGFYLSYTYRLTKAFGLTGGSRFHWVNAFGKNDTESDPTLKFYLLDEGKGDLNPLLNKSRNMGYFEFFLGASFFMGRM